MSGVVKCAKETCLCSVFVLFIVAPRAPVRVVIA